MKMQALFAVVVVVLGGCAIWGQQADDSGKVTAKESTTMPTSQPMKVMHTDEEWRKMLTPEQYHVLRQAGTEAPFLGKYTDTETAGNYYCAACNTLLFHSNTKFHSGCGWPSFYAAAAGDKVILRTDRSLGMVRTEVLCATCGSHLGHLFDDAPDQPTGQRYCINSVALKFVPDKPATTQAAKK